MTDIYSAVSHYNNGEGFFTIDAWKTDDGNEEGKVVAVVSEVCGDVYYIDSAAKESSAVSKEIINIKKKLGFYPIVEEVRMLERELLGPELEITRTAIVSIKSYIKSYYKSYPNEIENGTINWGELDTPMGNLMFNLSAYGGTEFVLNDKEQELIDTACDCVDDYLSWARIS